MDIRIHRLLPRTEVEGPGTRFCIWVQGCPIRCKGCAQPETWDFEAGEVFETGTISEMIRNTDGIEGITFLGGEPFYQAAALYEIASDAKQMGLTVLTFTGYQYETLVRVNRDDWNRLLSVTDLLIDGPFEEDKYDLSRPWVGSSNQCYRFLTPVYRHLEHNLHTFKNRLEVRIKENGAVLINGMGDVSKIKEYLRLYKGTEGRK